MLTAAGGSAPLIKAAAEKSHGLGLFVRSLVGLDREAAIGAFSELSRMDRPLPIKLNSSKWWFRNLCRNGIVDPSRLFETPYVSINSQGPIGVFSTRKGPSHGGCTGRHTKSCYCCLVLVPLALHILQNRN